MVEDTYYKGLGEVEISNISPRRVHKGVYGVGMLSVQKMKAKSKLILCQISKKEQISNFTGEELGACEE